MTVNKQSYTLAELVDGLEATIIGDANCVIKNVATIQHATPGSITFLTNPTYRKHLANTEASAVILMKDDAAFCPVNAIVTSNPYFTYAKIASYFDVASDVTQGFHHPTAVIAESAEVDKTAMIGPNCVIAENVKIGARVVIGAGCFIGPRSQLNDDVQLDARVTIYHDVRIGKRSRIMSGAVIGSDGFGFANQKGVWHKVPQLGGVTIGEDVDIGANTTIDRGAIEDTVIGDGVKLDNLIQIGHNVKIGANTIIAGCTGIAGSTVIGKHCMIGGACSIVGHIEIGDKVILAGGTGVSKSIKEPGMYSSGVVGAVPFQEFRKNNARFYRLENLMERVKALEIELKAFTERKES